MYRTLILAAFLALLAAGCRTSASNYGCCHRAPAPSPCSTCPPGGAIAAVPVPPPPPFR